MTLRTYPARWLHLGDGVKTNFSYTARIDFEADAVVYTNGLFSEISYSVNGLGNDAGGEVVFNTPPPFGTSIIIERRPRFQQLSKFQSLVGVLPVESQESSFDRIVMMMQAVRLGIDDLYNYLGVNNSGGDFTQITGKIPFGIIVGWHGSVVDLPPGWFLCDGNNGTPDLRGRMIPAVDDVGIRFLTVGERGGGFITDDNTPVGGSTDGTSLTIQQIPNHKHDVNVPNNSVLAAGSGSSTVGGGQQQTTFSVDDVTGHAEPVGFAQPHLHSFSEPAHGHGYLPTEYVLAFIQFQGIGVNPPTDPTDPDPPVPTVPPTLIGLLADQSYTVGVAITPIDTSVLFDPGTGTSLTYSATGLPEGIVINSTTGEISGAPTSLAADSSPYSVIVTLTTEVNPPATTNEATWAVDLANKFPSKSGYEIWLQPDNVIAAGGNVTRLNNDATASAGATADMVQTGASMPEDTFNGFPIVRSADTTSRYLITGSTIDILLPFTFFLVGRFELANNGALIDHRSNDRMAVLDLGGLFQIFHQNLSGFASKSNTQTVPTVFGARFESGNSRGRVSGGAGWVDDASVISGGFGYGRLLETLGGTQAQGWVGEVVIWETACTDTELQTEYDRLTSKWGIAP